MTVQDLTDCQFGLLTVAAYSHSFNGAAKWFCVCRCKARRVCDGSDLRNGRVEACKSCARQLKHGRLKLARAGQHPRSTDPAKLAAMLSDTARADYERWEQACAVIRHPITKTERLDVLRELVDRRAA